MSAEARHGGREPSWAVVGIGALVGVLFGALLGVVFLVLKPVISVKNSPDDNERERGAVYFIEGTRDIAKAKLASAKRKTFAAGGSVVVDENELNFFTGSAARMLMTSAAPLPVAEAAPDANRAPPAEALLPTAASAEKLGVLAPSRSRFGYVAGAPNFRIHDHTLQLAVPTKIYGFGLKVNVLVQGRGTFVKAGGNFVYNPTTLLVGSCPMDRWPMARNFVVKKIFEAQSVPEDVTKVWATLSDVAAVGSVLELTLP